LAPNDVYALSLGAGFDSRTTHHMRKPNMAIIVKIRCPFLMIFAPYFAFVTVGMKKI
jgi:hypothetical protein